MEENTNNGNSSPQQGGMDPKTVGIISYLTIIGWIIALILNNQNKSDFASFHIRQMLGLVLLSIVFWFIPFVGWIANLLVFVLWLIGFIGAIQGQTKEVPVLGKFFQDWFKGI